MLDSGPIVFITSGMRAPDGISDVAAFAERCGRQLQLMLRMPPRTEPVLFEKRIEMLRRSLPDDLQDLPIAGVQPKDYRAALDQLSREGGVMLAVAPTRRRNPIRTVMNNDYERLLLDTTAPVLALPRSNTIGPVQRILFPADLSPRSDQALDRTIALAKHLGAELHLLHVYGPDRLLPSEQDVQKRLATESPRELFNIDQERLRALAARATDAGVSVVAATDEGRAHTQILAYAAAKQADLIVLATHGPRSSADIFWGTTTGLVILKSPVAAIGIQA